MSIKLICAVSKNNVIGNNNKLPWNISEDLKRFRELTSENIIVMGRKTYDSIGRPLPKRENLVLSKNKKLKIENVKVFKSVVVGDRHIKSILKTNNGDMIKTIAFNSLGNDLGQFLLNDKRNTFNIVGKLTLNEWKGEKNVEFIIDDISVNKTLKKVPSSIG